MTKWGGGNNNIINALPIQAILQDVLIETNFITQTKDKYWKGRKLKFWNCALPHDVQLLSRYGQDWTGASGMTTDRCFDKKSSKLVDSQLDKCLYIYKRTWTHAVTNM